MDTGCNGCERKKLTHTYHMFSAELYFCKRSSGGVQHKNFLEWEVFKNTGCNSCLEELRRHAIGRHSLRLL